jgi:ketosteroid isomerase-like protein
MTSAVWRGVPAPRGEKLDYTGLDVIIVCDGKIAALYVFLDSIPS